jgi:NDP-sugar pyrophosphorylase family protein
MSCDKFIFGNGETLNWALASWSEIEPDSNFHPIEIEQNSDFQFKTEKLHSLNLSNKEVTAFITWGPQLLNFRRLELMGLIKALGFKMPPLICRHAIISSNVSIAENCVIGAGTIIGQGCIIGYNSVIGSGCVIGRDSRISSSVWINDGVLIAPKVIIDSNSIIGYGVILEEGVHIERQVMLDQPGRYTKSISSRTFLMSKFPHPVTVADYSAY